MAGDKRVSHYRKATFILSVCCGLLLIANLYLLLSADSSPSQIPSAKVDYDILNQIAGNFRKDATEPEGIDPLAQNIMLLTKFTMDMERSAGYTSDVEFMLDHACIMLLGDMQTKDRQAFVKENCDTLAPLYSNIFDAGRTNRQAKYSLAVQELYEFLGQNIPEGRFGQLEYTPERPVWREAPIIKVKGR
ncbi:MAG TPA: hypothetical protein GXX34_01405 [Clostridia bacterium]|nr:hypothetical protein [Clostridia bacterium]